MPSPSDGRGASACAQSASTTSPIPADPATKLTRKAAAAALCAAGFPISAATLSTMAARVGATDRGPEYEVFGRVSLYTWGVALAWAQGRMRPREERRHAAAERAAA